MKQVLFDPFPKQIEFLEAIFSKKYSFILYGGAIRGGKTFAGLGALILLCKMYPKSRWAVVRDSLTTLKRNTLPSWNKIKPDNFIKHYNKQDQVVTFANDSQLIFFSENYDSDKDLDRWKGLEVNGFLLEEINELQHASFLKAIERPGSNILPSDHKQPPPLIIATCNPARNWVRDKIYNKWKNNELNPEWKYIPAKITDNPYIPETYLKSLKNLPPYEYEVFVNGNWEIELKTGGEFYKSFDMDNHTGYFDYDSSLPLHISFDENVNPYLTATAYQVHNGTEIRQIAEFCYESPKNTVEAICRGIAHEYSGHLSGLFIYGDATSRKQDTKLERGHNFFTLIYDYLKEFHPTMRVPNSNPSVVMRGNFINHVLSKGYNGIGLKVDRDCKISIADFNNCKEAPDGTKSKTKERNSATGVSYEKYGHTSDTFDYFICEAFRSDYETYKTGRQDFNHVVIGGADYRQTNSY